MKELLKGFIIGLNSVRPKSSEGLSLTIHDVDSDGSLSEVVIDKLRSESWDEPDLPKIIKLNNEDFRIYLNNIFMKPLRGFDVANISMAFIRILDEEYGAYDLYGQLFEPDNGQSFLFTIDVPGERKICLLSWGD